MTDLTIRELIRQSHALSIEKGWYETWPDGKVRVNAINVPEKLALIHSEISEALEAYRDHGERRRCVACNGHGSILIDGAARPCPAGCTDGFLAIWMEPSAGTMKPEGMVTELADAMIRIADLCGALGLDLAAAIETKHSFNKGREYRHGGKRC
jgi:hypothetical protein